MLLNLNVIKRKVICYGPKDRLDTVYYIQDGNSTYTFEKVESIKDLGVTYDSSLSFCEHMQQKINTAYSMLCIIKCNFISTDKKTFIILYEAL